MPENTSSRVGIERDHPPGTFRFALRALSHRNYRLFFSGQTISLIGTWMTRLATAWLVYRLTHSAWLLGLVGFAGQIPVLMSPFAGVWVDRWNRHRTLVVTQALAMLQSFALAALTLTKLITIHEILWLCMAQGLINAFDMPARQSFVVEMISRREDLASAIALNSSMVNAARLLGPAIAGVVIAAVGEGYCFLIDGISYIAVIASLLLMMVPEFAGPGRRRAVLEDLREGFHYVAHFVPIRSVLLLLAVVSLMGMPYTVLMPIFAGSILHGGAHTLGFLMGSVGVGALLSGAYLASRKSVLGLGRVVAASAALFGLGLGAFAASRMLWLSMILLVATGGGMMLQMAASNTILQTIVDDDKRGRVMSFYSMSIMGITPLGSLLAGFLASRVGAPATLAVGGCGCLLGAMWFLRRIPAIREVVRPIYRKLGILPEIAAAMRDASAMVEE